MIKLTKNIKDEYTNGKIQDLFSEVDAVLQKRQAINEFAGRFNIYAIKAGVSSIIELSLA